jgi:hypothetical protein
LFLRDVGLTQAALAGKLRPAAVGALILETLDDIDWSHLQGCYQPATEVPEFLRALASRSCEIRDRARAELWSAIFHSGTVYEVTASVVPFLYELLENDDVLEKEHIVYMLATLANAQSYFAWHANDPTRAAQWAAILAKQGKTLADELSRELGYVAAVKHAVAARLDALYPYIRSSEAEIRWAVAEALRNFPEIAARLSPDLQAVLKNETDNSVREALRGVIQCQIRDRDTC